LRIFRCKNEIVKINFCAYLPVRVVRYFCVIYEIISLKLNLLFFKGIKYLMLNEQLCLKLIFYL